MRGVIAALVAIGISFAISVPAAAKTSGKQTFNGVIAVSGASGTREVVNSIVIAKGVLRGIGRVVEIPDLPGDPPNVLRDHLVFAPGSIEIRSVAGDPSFPSIH